jgi:coenzyme PQQ biosynthesis protein PqqD
VIGHDAAPGRARDRDLDLDPDLAADSRLALAGKVRLRRDPKSGQMMLLYPERGLELSETAARIADLCRQERTLGSIIDELVVAYGAPSRERVTAEVTSFLRALRDRGLLVIGPAAPLISGGRE